MKRTTEISDALLTGARRVAERQPFELRKASFRGRGPQAPLTEGQWDRDE